MLGLTEVTVSCAGFAKRFIARGRLVLLLGVVLQAIVVAGCSKDPSALFEDAKARAAKGDKAGAIIQLKSALGKEPNNGAMRFMLGRVYNETYDPPSAEKELRRATELGVVEGGRVAVELARSLRVQGKFLEVLKDVEPRSAYEKEQLASIHALRGRSLQSLGKDVDAKKSLAEAQALSPENPDVVLLQAQIKIVEGEADVALSLVDRLVARVPGNLEALTYRAGILRHLGRTDDSLKAFLAVLTLHPTHYGALRGITVLLTWGGKVDEAQKYMDVLKQAYKGHPQILLDQGVIDFVQKKYDKARVAAEMVLKSHPQMLPAQLLLGLAQQALGNSMQAEQSLTQYVTADPKSLIGRYALAAQLLSMNQARKASDVLRPALNENLNDPSIMILAGDISSRVGDHGKAFEWYDKAAKLDPTRADAQVARAFVQLRLGQIDTGLEGLEGAFELLKRASPSDEVLVMVSLARGDFERAARVISNIEKQSPNSPITFNLKGMVLLATGRKPEAVQAFEAALKLQPGFFPAAHNLARLDLGDGNLDAARKRYGIVLGTEKNDMPSLLALAGVERQAGRVLEEEEYLERAIKARPSYVEPKRRMVRSLWLRGEKERAVELSEKAFAASPDDASAIMLAAETQLLAGNTNRAVQIITRLEAADKNSASVQVTVAQIQSAAGRVTDAERSLRKALLVEPRYEPAQRNIVGLLMASGRDSSALEFARQVQKSQSKDTIGFVLEAAIHEAKRRYPEALAAYGAAQVRSVGNGVVAAGIYRVRAASGKRKEGLAELEKFVQDHPRVADARLVLAFVKYSEGDLAGAAAQYEALASYHPNDTAGMNGLAWVYHKLKDPRARITAERAYGLNLDSPQIQDTLGVILLDAGEIKRGHALIAMAAAALPNDPDVRFHLAFALNKAGDKTGARQQLTQLLSTPKLFESRREAEKLLESLRD